MVRCSCSALVLLHPRNRWFLNCLMTRQTLRASRTDQALRTDLRIPTAPRVRVHRTVQAHLQSLEDRVLGVRSAGQLWYSMAPATVGTRRSTLPAVL